MSDIVSWMVLDSILGYNLGSSGKLDWRRKFRPDNGEEQNEGKNFFCRQEGIFEDFLVGKWLLMNSGRLIWQRYLQSIRAETEVRSLFYLVRNDEHLNTDACIGLERREEGRETSLRLIKYTWKIWERKSKRLVD